MTSVTDAVITPAFVDAPMGLPVDFVEFSPQANNSVQLFSSELFIENGYRFTHLTAKDLNGLTLLQDEVMASLKDKSWLRANTADMLVHCLAEHTSVGVRFGDALVAAAVLYDGGTSKESIRGYFTEDEDQMKSSINLKLVLASAAHRGMGLGRKLVEALNQQALLMGKKEVACTIHPENTPSQALFSRLGYQHVGDVTSSYGARKVFARPLC